MKRVLICAAMSLLWAQAAGQSTAEAFMALLPPVPNVSCTADTSVIAKFSKQIDVFSKAFRNYSEKLSQKGEEYQQEDADKMAEAALSKAGISMQEAEKLSNMSEAEQEKWAKEYAEKMMAKSMAGNSGKNSDAQKMTNLAQRQKALVDEMEVMRGVIASRAKDVEIADTLETRKLNKALAILAESVKDVTHGEGATAADARRWEAYTKACHNEQINYCGNMSPLWINYVESHLSFTKKLIPMLREVAQIEAEIFKIQFNKLPPVVDNETYAIIAVEDYSYILARSYDFWVGKYELHN